MPSGARTRMAGAPLPRTVATLRRCALAAASALCAGAQAGLAVAPHLPHSETLARIRPPTGGTETLQRAEHHACGGIGAREQTAMKDLAHEYDLMLTFATRGGHYLADVDVQVTDARGRVVLATRCDAPMMVVDVPHPGRYTVHARSGGTEVRRLVRVSAGRTTSAVLRWPDGR